MTDTTKDPIAQATEEALDALEAADPADAPEMAEKLADGLAADLAATDTPRHEMQGEDS